MGRTLSRGRPAGRASFKGLATWQPTTSAPAQEPALVDAAPWLPLYNNLSVVLLSRRVGGYRLNPLYGTLIDQLWVR
jgi:hypothetical protein